MQQRDQVASEIEAFMREAFEISPQDSGFTHDVDLFEEGYVDSLGVTESIAFLEDRYGIELVEDDLLSDEFTTIGGMAAIVCRYEQRAATPAPSGAGGARSLG